jgi:hypothetical protein
MIRPLLRSTSIAIALVALLDPALTVTGRQRPRLAITLQRPNDPVSLAVRARLTRDLGADFDVAGPDREAAAAVVIGREYPDRADAFPPRTSTVTVDAGHPGETPIIAGVRAPRAVPRGTRIQLEVTLDAQPATTAATSVVAVAAGPVGHPDVEVARVSHTWAAGSRRAVLTLDAMPLDLPPWHLRVRVSEASQPSTAATSDVLVEEATPPRVLFYEPRPSWIATFVRRAIEADQRFVVSGLEYPSRGIPIVSGDAASLDQTALRAFSAVVVGGLDRLTVSDRDRLDWFVRERGGSLVLLPDARPGVAPWTEWLFGATTREELLERPSALAVVPPLPGLHVSELLTFTGARVLGARVLGAGVPDAMVPGATVLARVAGSNEPVVCLVPHGAGRILVSGALDAWRYRAEKDSGFDRFWRSAIAGVALATPAAVNVEIAPPVARPGESVRIVARVHRAALAAGAAGALQVSARLDSGLPVRLWPDAEPDVFSGSFAAGVPADLSAVASAKVDASAKAGQAGVQRITVSAAPDGAEVATGSAVMAVDPSARRAERPVPLSLLATSRGGIDVTPDRLADLEAYLRREVSAPPVRTTTHPMRSGWWIVPFAAGLTGEWWLRRRKGLR